MSGNVDKVILTGVLHVGFYFVNERMRLKWLLFVQWPKEGTRPLHFLFVLILGLHSISIVPRYFHT